MPVTVEEKLASRSGDQTQVDLVYVVRGTDDDTAARQALIAAAPATHAGLLRQDSAVRVEPVGPGLWEGTVRYGRRGSVRNAPGSLSLRLELGGGTQHITQSLQTVARYPGNAPDYQGAIGVTHDNVEGVDIVVPTVTITAVKVWPPAPGNVPNAGAIYALIGKVNSSSFTLTDTFTGMTITLAAGECLLSGAQIGGAREDGAIEASYSFGASPNATGLTVGSITGIAKKGWEYLWVRHEDAEDQAASALVKRPTAVYIERVYPTGDFGTLGIGT